MQDSFLLHIKRFECTTCDNCWETSDLYRISVFGDQRQISPHTGDPHPGCPFGISRLPPRKVTVCFTCAPAFEAQRTKELETSEQNWAETLRRKSLESSKEAPKVAKVNRGPVAPTLDQL